MESRGYRSTAGHAASQATKAKSQEPSGERVRYGFDTLRCRVTGRL